MVSATVGVELLLLPLDEHGDWSAAPGLPLPVPLPLPPGQVATSPTVSTCPPTAEVPSGSTTVTASPGFTRYSWFTFRATVTIGVVLVAVSTVPPPPLPPPPPRDAPTEAVSEVTRMGPGSNTTWPSRMLP